MNKLLKNLLVFCMAVAGLASCSMMETDRSDCPSGIYVRFVYDYNVQRADMRKDHVGGITLYVFDESDRLVMQRDVANEGDYTPLRSYDFSMHLTPGELPEGRYRLVAVAQQKGYDATLATSGAKFRRTDMQAGSLLEELKLRLDRQPAEAAGISRVNADAPLDTLWVGSTLNPDRNADEKELGQTFVEMHGQTPTYATVWLVRDTKHIHVEMRQLDDPTGLSDDDYEVTITDANGLLGPDNTVLEDEPLLYSPYNAWTLRSAGGNYNTAHYDLNCSRLMYDADNSANNARLRIYDKKEQREILSADLPAWLAEARITPEYRYATQEYLDRQYDYRLEIILKGSTWHEVYVHVQLNMLNWSKRIQNVDL